MSTKPTDMDAFMDNLEKQLERKLFSISLEYDKPLQKSEKSIIEITRALHQLKAFLLQIEFISESEEIDFFKNRKPLFLSKLIYFNDIFKMETRKPSGGEKMIRKYYQTELLKLKVFFEENVEFYGYYRTQSTYLDPKYFLREKLDIRLSLDSFVFESDSRFSTSHDFKVAKIMAHDLLEVYISDELLRLNRNSDESYNIPTPKTKLVWSDNKTALIELIYALHYKNSFNNGQADIKEISAYFEAVFNIELGDVYRTFLEIKNRSVRTKYLISLEELLNKKMEERDA